MATRLPTFIAAICLSGAALADPMMLEEFSNKPAARWDCVSHQVRGGVSEGQAVFTAEGGTTHVRLTGGVSTANNRGFIQVRQRIGTPFMAETDGVALQIRGNGERYLVHLRTTATTLP